MSEPWKPPVAPKQLASINENKQLVLLDGPRRCGKTVACCHKVARHLWEVPGATALMIGQTITKNYNEGAWTDLKKIVLPQWFAGDFGFDFKRAEKPELMESVTHRYYIDTTNAYTEEPNVPDDWRYSRIYLDSVPDEKPTSLEAKLKGKRFTFIYVTELSDFRSRLTFDTLTECLRTIEVPEYPNLSLIRIKSQQIICDTNPGDEGEDSWIWKMWYWFRTLNIDQLEEDERERLMTEFNIIPEDYDRMIVRLRAQQRDLALHHFVIDDNPYITEVEKAKVWAKYAHNKSLLDRYYYGKWTRSSGIGYFVHVWRPEVHVVGRPPGIFNREAEVMVPEEDSLILGRGWDTGSANFSCQFIENVSVEVEYEGKQQLRIGFKVFDEVISIGGMMSLPEIMEQIMEKTAFWERFTGHSIQWRDWADSSAFSRHDAGAHRTEAREIFLLSEGSIRLRAVGKPAGSVQARLDLLGRLLLQDRVRVSAAKCPITIEMFERLQRNKKGTIDRGTVHKHPFDSLTYYMASECESEINEQALKVVARKRFERGFNNVITTRI